MATNYPSSLDTSSEQPSPGATTDLDAAGYEHHTVHTNHSGALIALETKLGIGASAASGASDGDVMTKQADGSTAWEAAAGGGASWSGSTANGIATYGDASTIVAESTATYDGTTLQLTTSGGGLKMDGLASADANTLDDYEEGTWTPVLSPASGSIGLLTGWDLGSYVKVGGLVTVMGRFYIDSTAISTPSGTLQLTGLPFTVAALGDHADETASFMHIANPSTTSQVWILLANSSSTTAQIYAGSNMEPGMWTSPASLIDTGTQELGVCFSYRTAA